MDADEAIARARTVFLDERHVHGCAETALLVLVEAFDLSDGADTSAAMALNGGVAYSGGICGAITGAAIAVGLFAGARIPDHARAKKEAREIVAAAIDEFRRRHGAVECRALLGFDIGTPEQHRAFLESGVWREGCMRQIETVVGGLAELPLDARWQQSGG